MVSISSSSSDASVDTDSDSTREVCPQSGRSSASTRVVSVGSAKQGYDDVEPSVTEAPCKKAKLDIAPEEDMDSDENSMERRFRNLVGT